MSDVMSDTASEALLDILCARRGIVCAVGAGGKKSVLSRLAAIHPGRVGLTTTVMTHQILEPFDGETVVRPKGELLPAVVEAAAKVRQVAFARAVDKPGRFGGIDGELLHRIADAAKFDAVFIKSDGARMRLIKAPSDHEPELPSHPATVLPVVSARAIGRTLDERAAHRVERLASVTGANPGEPITAMHVAKLLASPDGALRRVGDAAVVPVINMIDGDAELSAALEAATAALALTDRFDRIALTRMTASDPVVRVVAR